MGLPTRPGGTSATPARVRKCGGRGVTRVSPGEASSDRRPSWPSGRGFGALSGVFPHWTGVATPSCAPNPRPVPRTRVQTVRTERGVGVVGQRLESAAGCLLHRWVPPAPWGAVGTQPKVLGATTGAQRSRRCSAHPSRPPTGPSTPAPAETRTNRKRPISPGMTSEHPSSQAGGARPGRRRAAREGLGDRLFLCQQIRRPRR